MAKTRGTAVFRYQPSQGIFRTAAQMSRAARELRNVIIREMRGSQDDVQDTFESRAPYDSDERDSYHLRDHIEARLFVAGRVRVTVYATAKDPRNGFDYLDITRKGHRGPIRPKRAPLLRWRAGGRSFTAKETAGSHPDSDWVEEALPEAEQIAEDVADRVGRVVYTRLLS